MKRVKKFFIILMIIVMTMSSSPINIATQLNAKEPFSVVAQAAKAKTHLNKTKKSIYIGKKYTLKLLDKKGKTITATKVKWKSSNKKIASVNKNGVVTGKKAGKAKITATYKGKKYVATITVKSTVSVNKTKLTFSADSTERKAVTVTFKESGSIMWDIVDGEDLIDCEWDRNWNGNTIKLYITPSGDDFGNARVKIYSEDRPERCAYVDVEIKSPYTLTVKNKLPCYVSFYESDDYYDEGHEKSTVKINKVNYEVTSSGYMTIVVEFEAYDSYYDEGYYHIKYRVLDEDGYVVEFDSVMSERMFIGDKAKEEIIVYGLEKGDYTIEFLDHYATD